MKTITTAQDDQATSPKVGESHNGMTIQQVTYLGPIPQDEQHPHSGELIEWELTIE